ncbi:hypothetical protein [Rhodococcus qingshengii]|nr:hypothetical protein [Rhodococcus qingshengii]MBT2273603.1 hypothetical protein [Rhodococcus qingshengii]
MTNQLLLYPKSEVELGHTYMGAPSPRTDDYTRLRSEFLAGALTDSNQ